MQLSYEMYFSVRWKNVVVSTRKERKKMGRTLLGLLVAGSLWVALNVSSTPAQVPDGTVKITRRVPVSEGIGLSWGEGVLTYKGGTSIRSAFTASGRLREVDVGHRPHPELLGQVFNLKNLEEFNGNYKSVEGENAASGGGTRATLKNPKGVVVDLVSTVAGRKLALAREGMDIELEKQKP